MSNFLDELTPNPIVPSHLLPCTRDDGSRAGRPTPTGSWKVVRVREDSCTFANPEERAGCYAASQLPAVLPQAASFSLPFQRSRHRRDRSPGGATLQRMEKAGRGPATTPGCSLAPIPGERSGLLAAAGAAVVAAARELLGQRRAATLRRCRPLRPAARPAPPSAPYSALDFAESADPQRVPQHVVADLHPPVVLRRLFQLSHLRSARLGSAPFSPSSPPPVRPNHNAAGPGGEARRRQAAGSEAETKRGGGVDR